jgi:hypothetical protein
MNKVWTQLPLPNFTLNRRHRLAHEALPSRFLRGNPSSSG